MQDEILFLAEESVEGGYSASAVGYQIVAEARTLDELKERIRSAVLSYFKGRPVPCLVRLNVLREELITVC